MTKIELELIPDSVMFIFFEKGARDKSSYISNRHNKAKYLKSFDPKQESKLIIYLNANILYAYAMPKFLPRSELKWIDLKEFHLNRYTSNSSKGWALEVDFEYPKEFRKLHNYYPLAPGKTEISKSSNMNYWLFIFKIFLLTILNNYCLTILIKKSMCFTM